MEPCNYAMICDMFLFKIITSNEILINLPCIELKSAFLVVPN